MVKLTIVLPTLNERDNLPQMVAELFALDLPDIQTSLLVVDNASPDGTGQIADGLSHTHRGRLGVLHLGGVGGLGTAYRAGFARALAEGADLVLQMDCDFSHPPSAIPRMVEALALSGADMVLGSRYVAGAALGDEWPWWRHVLSGFANRLYVRAALGKLAVQDVTGGFRLWRAETLHGMGFADRVESTGYIFQVEMTYLAHRLGYRMIEIPIRFEERRAGESKMSVAIQFEAAWRLWPLRRRLSSLGPGDRRVVPARVEMATTPEWQNTRSVVAASSDARLHDESATR